MHPHRIVEETDRTRIPTRTSNDQDGQRSPWLRWCLRVFRAIKAPLKVH